MMDEREGEREEEEKCVRKECLLEGKQQQNATRKYSQNNRENENEACEFQVYRLQNNKNNQVSFSLLK